MNLFDAVRRVAPAVDTKGSAYVKAEGGQLYAYSGQAWMAAEVELDLEFCVRHDQLVTTLSTRSAPEIDSDGAHGLVLRQGRRRVQLYGVEPRSVPSPGFTNVVAHLTLPSTFRAMVENLTVWLDHNAAFWMMGVHLTPEFVFVCNRQEAARYDVPFALAHPITIPEWACRMILAAKVSPTRLIERENLIEIRFPDGAAIHTMKLADEPPLSVLGMMKNLVRPGTDVPPGLHDIIKDLLRYKAKDALIGQGKISTVPEENDRLAVDDEVDVGGPVRQWNVAALDRALDWAETIDLVEGLNATWAGAGFVGTFSGSKPR